MRLKARVRISFAELVGVGFSRMVRMRFLLCIYLLLLLLRRPHHARCVFYSIHSYLLQPNGISNMFVHALHKAGNGRPPRSVGLTPATTVETGRKIVVCLSATRKGAFLPPCRVYLSVSLNVSNLFLTKWVLDRRRQLIWCGMSLCCFRGSRLGMGARAISASVVYRRTAGFAYSLCI